MARHESDREDLMREATALKRRVELVLPGQTEPVIAGFRSDEFLSLYFGADPVYHFDGEGRLRRAYMDGHLFRTQGETLARLARVRTSAATELQRHDLRPGELQTFLTEMTGYLNTLKDAISGNTATLVQQVPADDEILPDLTTALNRILARGPSLAPPIKGKR